MTANLGEFCKSQLILSTSLFKTCQLFSSHFFLFLACVSIKYAFENVWNRSQSWYSYVFIDAFFIVDTMERLKFMEKHNLLEVRNYRRFFKVIVANEHGAYFLTDTLNSIEKSLWIGFLVARLAAERILNFLRTSQNYARIHFAP